jgi:hypothetical protein
LQKGSKVKKCFQSIVSKMWSVFLCYSSKAAVAKGVESDKVVKNKKSSRLLMDYTSQLLKEYQQIHAPDGKQLTMTQLAGLPGLGDSETAYKVLQA